MRVMVTGAAGFIGAEICRRLLVSGAEVTGLDNFHPHYSVNVKKNNLAELSLFKGFSFLEGDITDGREFSEILKRSRCNMVVHFAAEVGAGRSMIFPGDYYKVNVLGTQNVIDASVSLGIKKIIMASTSNIYGDNIEPVLKENEAIPDPVTPYAVSKLVNECMGKIASDQYGIDIVVLRIFSAYGPGQRPDLAIHKFTRLIESGQPVRLFSDNKSYRDYVYSVDIAQAVVKCLEHISGFQLMNIGSGRGIHLYEVIEILENIIGVKADVIYIDPPPGHINSGIADITKAEKLIGYKPVFVFDKGVREFYKWFKKQGE